MVLSAFGGVGFLVVQRQPGNPVGWILLAVPALALTQTVAQLYSVLDYRLHDGSLRLGATAVYWDGAYTLLSLLFGLPLVLLFPAFAFVTRLWNGVATLSEMFMKSHLDSSMAPWWVLRKTRF